MERNMTAGYIRRQVSFWKWITIALTIVAVGRLFVVAARHPELFRPDHFGSSFFLLITPLLVAIAALFSFSMIQDRYDRYESVWKESLRLPEVFLKAVVVRFGPADGGASIFTALHWLIATYGLGPYETGFGLPVPREHADSLKHLCMQGFLLEDDDQLSLNWNIVYRDNPMPDDWFPGKPISEPDDDPEELPPAA